MGGLGHVLGGALQGIGQGMAMQAKEDMESRRSLALENLRSQNQRAETTLTADLNDRNAARNTARQTSSTIAVNKEQGKITAGRDATLHGYQVDEIKLRGAIDKQLKSQDAATAAEAARLKSEIDGGQVKDITAGGDGFYYKTYLNGKTERTNIPVAPKDLVGSSSGGGDILGQVRGAPTARTPAAPPKNRPSLDSFQR